MAKRGRILVPRSHWWQLRRRSLLCCYGPCELFGISLNYVDLHGARYTFCTTYHRDKFMTELGSD